MRAAPQIAMVAGEASGDVLASLLLGGLQARWPHLQALGIGGPQMMARGFQAWWPSDKLAVRGYVEVLRHYPEIVGIRQQLKNRLLTDKVQGHPDLFIGVDAPDFNLDLAAALKAGGLKTVQFVSPAIWAWRPERVDKIRRSVDHVLCIFPFEPALLAQQGIAASYVGHPLADMIPMQPDRAAARRALGLQDDDTVVALLPGSRRSEIASLAARFFQAAAFIQRSAKEAAGLASGVKFVLPAAPGLKPMIEKMAEQSGMRSQVHILAGQSHTALAACDVTLIASGTATLEAALFKRPMVIAYHMNWLSWQIMQRQKLQPWVGLPNILCGEFVVPELLQNDATPQALAQEVLAWLAAKSQTPEKITALENRFLALHNQLRQDTAQQATHVIAQILKR